jgi:O-antigen ligase
MRPAVTRSQKHAWLPGSTKFAVFAAFVILVALMGGGARSDITSLLVLRPLAVLAVAYGLLTISRPAFSSAAIPIYLLVAAMTITASQLLPLPAPVWTSLAGRAAFAQVYAEFGLPAGWHPLSLYPAYSWNSLFAMFVPFAGILLLAQVDGQSRSSTLLLFIGLVVGSATLGILQLLGSSNNVFYLYRVTNPGDPVGLFANRNHQAVFLACAFPLMAAYVALPRPRNDKGSALRTMMCVGAAIFILASIVATGSRSGTLVAVVAIIASFALIPASQWQMVTVGRKWYLSSRSITIAGVAIVSLVLLAFSARLTSLQRFIDLGGQDQVRLAALKTNAAIARDFFPWGAGMGTFPEIFGIYEPADFLDPQYLNHAHNDWIEIVIEGGLPAVILLVAATILIVWRAGPVLSRSLDGSHSGILARLGLVLLILLAIASVSDYPLRTPTMSVLLMAALYWLFGARSHARHDDQEHPKAIPSGRSSLDRNTSVSGA